MAVSFLSPGFTREFTEDLHSSSHPHLDANLCIPQTLLFKGFPEDRLQEVLDFGYIIFYYLSELGSVFAFDLSCAFEKFDNFECGCFMLVNKVDRGR